MVSLGVLPFLMETFLFIVLQEVIPSGPLGWSKPFSRDSANCYWSKLISNLFLCLYHYQDVNKKNKEWLRCMIITQQSDYVLNTEWFKITITHPYAVMGYPKWCMCACDQGTLIRCGFQYLEVWCVLLPRYLPMEGFCGLCT